MTAGEKAFHGSAYPNTVTALSRQWMMISTRRTLFPSSLKWCGISIPRPRRIKSPTKELAKACLSIFDELANVLGVIYNSTGKADDALAKEVEALIEARQAARKEKNWAEADRIRDQLKDMGIVLMDTPQGVKWKKSIKSLKSQERG